MKRTAHAIKITYLVDIRTSCSDGQGCKAVVVSIWDVRIVNIEQNNIALQGVKIKGRSVVLRFQVEKPPQAMSP